MSKSAKTMITTVAASILTLAVLHRIPKAKEFLTDTTSFLGIRIG